MKAIRLLFGITTVVALILLAGIFRSDTKETIPDTPALSSNTAPDGLALLEKMRAEREAREAPFRDKIAFIRNNPDLPDREKVIDSLCLASLNHEVAGELKAGESQLDKVGAIQALQGIMNGPGGPRR